MAHAARVGIIGNLTQRHLEVANKQLDAMLTTEPFETLVTLGGPTMDGLVTQYVRQRGLSLSAAPLPWSERGIDWHNLDLASRRIQKLWVFWDGEDSEFAALCQRFRFFDIPSTFIVF